MLEWSRAFGDVPVFLHADDRRWVMREGPAIHFWERRLVVRAGFRARANARPLRRTFSGWSSVALGGWTGGSGCPVVRRRGGKCCRQAGGLSFMYSFPNLLPLSVAAVRRIGGVLEPFAFERMYGAWWGPARCPRAARRCCDDQWTATRQR